MRVFHSTGLRQAPAHFWQSLALNVERRSTQPNSSPNSRFTPPVLHVDVKVLPNYFEVWEPLYFQLILQLPKLCSPPGEHD